MIPRGMKSKFIQKIYQMNYDKLCKKLITSNSNFLDIGAGLGFLKPIVKKYNGTYFGLEPRDEAIEFAKTRYGSDGYTQGFFPDDSIVTKDMLEGGVIMSLTTLDEVFNKVKFLKGIFNISNNNTKIFLATRNADWILSRSDDVVSIKNENLKDLNVNEYKKLFFDNGFDIVNIEKIPRPFLTSFTINGIKSVIVAIIENFTSVEKSYMVGYHLQRREK